MSQAAQPVCGLDAAAVRSWCALALERLAANRDLLNEANVFPVADADTGTNMYLTLRGGLQQLDDDSAAASSTTPPSAGAALASVAHGALMAARGNSGIILSEYLRGFARCALEFSRGGESDLGRQLTRALRAAATSAFAAVAQPAPGTILTVARVAAEAAEAATAGEVTDEHSATEHSATEHSATTPTEAAQYQSDNSAAVVARTALLAGHTALDATAEQLDALASARVLDAGAYGLVIILSALERILDTTLDASLDPTRPSGLAERTSLRAAIQNPNDPPAAQRESAVNGANTDAKTPAFAYTKENAHLGAATGYSEEVFHHLDHNQVDGEFEVMYLVHATLSEQEAQEFSSHLRVALQEIGESVVVVGGAAHLGTGLWNVHVHTDWPDQAMRAAETLLRATSDTNARLSRVLVRDLTRQVSSNHTVTTVICTSAPGIVPDIARGGAVVLLARSGELTLTDIARGRSEAEGVSRVIVVNQNELARHVRAAYPDDHVVVASDDARVVAVATALTLAGGGPATAELANTLQDVADGATTWRLEHPSREELGAILATQLAPQAGTLPIVTVLADERCPVSLLADLHDGLERTNPSAELITLASGRNGQGLTVSIEWVDE